MTINLIPTKVIVPKRSPGVIRRPRLTDALHANLERRLILVTAPAGYGKTTLLVDFASDVDLPVCWYTLDEGDRDPNTFMAHLVASFRRQFPSFGERTMSLSASSVTSPRATAAALIADMVNDIPEYFVLILDDWHLVGEEAAIREMLDHLLRYLPEHAHTIVAGRTLLRGPLIRLASQGAVAGLGPSDLRFTASEVRELLIAKYNLEIAEERAARLADESEGWITGILLTSHGMWRELLSGLIHTMDGSRTLYDYLAGEVFDLLSPQLRRFLLESAVPKQFTATMCDELRGAPESATWLDQVEARNLFLTRVVADGETWFRYHHLFRDFLLARFARDDPAGLAQLHLRSGEWFEARQQPEEAVEHYLAADAPTRAARVMDVHARSMYLAGRARTLLRWADLLPVELRSTAPDLALFQGQTLFERGRSSEALTALQRAEDAFRIRGDALGQLRATLAQGWSHLARGKSHDALAVGRLVLNQLDERQLNEPMLRAHAFRLLGTSYSRLGQWQSGEKYLAQALAAYRQGDASDRQAFDLGNVLQDLAYVLRAEGRLEEAAALQAESLVLWRKIGNPGLLAASLNNAGYDRFLIGDYDGALRLYLEALAKAEEADDRRSQAYMQESIATTYRDRGEFQRAIETYSEVFETANAIGDQWLVSWTLDGLGHAYRLADNLDRASALFDQAKRLAQREGNDAQVTLFIASSGIVKVEQGNAIEGATELEHASRDLQAADSHLDLARVLLWLARAYHLSQQPVLAKDGLMRLLRLGGRLGCRPFSLAEGRRAEAFLAWAASEPDTDGRLHAWLDTLQPETAPGQIAPAPERAKPRIEIRAFGPGQVFRDGRLLSIQEWGGSAIARELLFYLFEQSPVRKEEIGAVFWPDFSLAKMNNTFHAAKYRARRALGVEFILYSDDFYRIDPNAGIWYDVAEFGRLLDTAQRRSVDDAARLAKLQQALALYTGDYLTGMYSDWILERRQALQARYFDALNQVVDILMRRREFERALVACQRGIELDYYREDLHRGMMQSLTETGRRAEALIHYRELARRLRRELRTAPAQETRDLFTWIRSLR